VSVLDGHTAYVSVKFRTPPTREQIRERWEKYRAEELPTAPRQIIHYLEEPDRPQPLLDVMTENGMAVSVGQLSIEDDGTVYFTALSHNAILGAAGGAVLATEAAIARNLVYRRI
jgi:aspartate-semialdehyde dehydrogenase